MTERHGGIAEIGGCSSTNRRIIAISKREATTMGDQIKRLAAVAVAAFAFAVTGPDTAASANTSTTTPINARSSSGYTLVNYPGPVVCRTHQITVGVWAQPGTSRANRRYVVNVYDPNWVRVLHKAGYAPTSHWQNWHPTAWKLGNYRTVYKIWHNGVMQRSKYVTTSKSCG